MVTNSLILVMAVRFNLGLMTNYCYERGQKKRKTEKEKPVAEMPMFQVEVCKVFSGMPKAQGEVWALEQTANGSQKDTYWQ